MSKNKKVIIALVCVANLLCLILAFGTVGVKYYKGVEISDKKAIRQLGDDYAKYLRDDIIVWTHVSRRGDEIEEHSMKKLVVKAIEIKKGYLYGRGNNARDAGKNIYLNSLSKAKGIVYFDNASGYPHYFVFITKEDIDVDYYMHNYEYVCDIDGRSYHVVRKPQRYANGPELSEEESETARRAEFNTIVKCKDGDFNFYLGVNGYLPFYTQIEDQSITLQEENELYANALNEIIKQF